MYLFVMQFQHLYNIYRKYVDAMLRWFYLIHVTLQSIRYIYILLFGMNRKFILCYLIYS